MDNIGFFISKFRELSDVNRVQAEKLPRYSRARAYRNAAVQLRPCALEDFEERRRIVEETGLNVFFFPSNKIPGCDLLSDSGTTTMTMEQWAQLLLGDEAYGSNEGFFELKDQITELFGPDWKQTNHKVETLFMFHQGRAAEHALFGVLSGIHKKRRRRLHDPFSDELIIPSNSHFDTTEANIENNQLTPLNLPCQEHIEDNDNFPFRGNIDVTALEDLLRTKPGCVPLIYLTITNNTGGGQPVSMANIQAVSKIARDYAIPFFFDASRFAENAWFIQQKEAGYRQKSIPEIVHEMFSYVDGCHISFKKDGLVNIGGGIVIKEQGQMDEKYPEFRNKLTDHQILTEGHPTYGGLAGRDLKSLVQGLKTVVRQDYLDHRIGQIERFGNKLKEYNIPLIHPLGGHAIYIKLDEFFGDTDTEDDDFKGIALTALLLIAGHRLIELGLYAFGRYDAIERRERAPRPRVNNVRGAVPRLTYEDQDLFAAAEAIKILYDHRHKIPAVDVVYGQELKLRHFKSRFQFRGQ